jgi:hypothetical protein
MICEVEGPAVKQTRSRLPFDFSSLSLGVAQVGAVVEVRAGSARLKAAQGYESRRCLVHSRFLTAKADSE